MCLYLSICLYYIAARSHISTTTRPNFMKFSVHVTLGHGSILRSEQWNTLCTSGFADDVMFSHDGPYGVWHWQYLRERRVDDMHGAAIGWLSAANDCVIPRWSFFNFFTTFRVSRRRCEMYSGHARLCVCVSVCLCLCIVSACPSPHSHTAARTRM